MFIRVFCQTQNQNTRDKSKNGIIQVVQKMNILYKSREKSNFEPLTCIIHTKIEKVLNLLQISKHITIFAIRNKKPKKELFHERK